MSKMYVIGSREAEGVSKKTGKPFHSFQLQCIKHDSRAFGYGVAELYIDINSPLYALISKQFQEVSGGLAPVQDDGAFIGAYFDVDFNTGGFIDSIEVLGYDPDAVVWALDFRRCGEK